MLHRPGIELFAFRAHTQGLLACFPVLRKAVQRGHALDIGRDLFRARLLADTCECSHTFFCLRIDLDVGGEVVASSIFGQSTDSVIVTSVFAFSLELNESNIEHIL